MALFIGITTPTGGSVAYHFTVRDLAGSVAEDGWPSQRRHCAGQDNKAEGTGQTSPQLGHKTQSGLASRAMGFLMYLAGWLTGGSKRTGFSAWNGLASGSSVALWI